VYCHKFSNNTFMRSKVDRLPPETVGDKASGGHKINNGHHKRSCHRDHTSFVIHSASNQKTCLGLKHKWQEEQ
jgi:hypothetical protein